MKIYPKNKRKPLLDFFDAAKILQTVALLQVIF